MSPTLEPIQCPGCGQPHVPKRRRPGQRYCSLECYRSQPKPQRRTGSTRACEQCGVDFYAPLGRADARFCSRNCHNTHQGRSKTEHRCKSCGATFRWSPSRSASGAYRITYCSIPCRDADPARRAMLLDMNARQQAGRMTRAEAAGYSLLDQLNVPHLRQQVFAGKFTPDAVVPSARLVVQFDGDYWHDRKGTSTEARIRRRVSNDRAQDAYVRACGWEVVRLWESDLMADPRGCLEVIRSAVARPLGPNPDRDPLGSVRYRVL